MMITTPTAIAPVKRLGQSARKRGLQRGFSLIELLITLAILSVVMGIALPNYSNYLTRAARSDAKAVLLEVAAVQERIYFERGQYTGDEADLWSETDGDDYVSNEGYYLLTVAIPEDGQSFSATATATGRQTRDQDCTSFTIDGTGQKSATAGEGGDSSHCW